MGFVILFNSGVSDELVRWRTVLKRQWDILLGDLCPDRVTSSLSYLPTHMCSILQDDNSYSGETLVNHAEKLHRHLSALGR